MSSLQAKADCVVLAANRNQQAVKGAFLRKRTIALCLRAVPAGETQRWGGGSFFAFNEDAADGVVIRQTVVDLSENLSCVLWRIALPDVVQPCFDFRHILAFDAGCKLRAALIKTGKMNSVLPAPILHRARTMPMVRTSLAPMPFF
jgi:hypothetical protein